MKFVPLILLLLLVGCSKRPGVPDQAKSAPPVEVEAPKDLKEANKRLAILKAEVARAEAHRDSIIEEREIEREENLKAWGWWIAVIGFLGMAGCVAGAVFLSGFRRWFILGAIACLAVAAMSIAFAWLVPSLKWIGLGILAAIIAGGVYLARRKDLVAKAMAGYTDDLKRCVDPEQKKALDRQHRKAQIDAGLHSDVHRLSQEAKGARHA